MGIVHHALFIAHCSALSLPYQPPSLRGVRVVEGARLESVYGSKGHRGFESHPLNKKPVSMLEAGFFNWFKRLCQTG